MTVPGVFALEVGACGRGRGFICGRFTWSNPLLLVLGLSEVALLCFLLGTIGRDAATVWEQLQLEDTGVESRCTGTNTTSEVCEVAVEQTTVLLKTLYGLALFTTALALVSGVCCATHGLVESYGHGEAEAKTLNRKPLIPLPRLHGFVQEIGLLFFLALFMAGFTCCFVVFVIYTEGSGQEPVHPMLSRCRFGQQDHAEGCCFQLESYNDGSPGFSSSLGPFCADGLIKVDRLPPSNNTQQCVEFDGRPGSTTSGMSSRGQSARHYQWYECVLPTDDDGASGSGFVQTAAFDSNGTFSGSFSGSFAPEDEILYWWKAAGANIVHMVWYLRVYARFELGVFVIANTAVAAAAMKIITCRPKRLGLWILSAISAVLAHMLLDVTRLMLTQTPNLLAGLVDDVLSGEFTALRAGYASLRPSACDGLEDAECRSTMFEDAARSELDSLLRFAMAFAVLCTLTVPVVMIFKQG
eukprot:SAG22_NODE_1471_length_4342_cov_3.522036_4_plen_469_part_00